jgi:WD40-like Beta Propeller Repeat
MKALLPKLFCLWVASGLGVCSVQGAALPPQGFSIGFTVAFGTACIAMKRPSTELQLQAGFWPNHTQAGVRRALAGCVVSSCKAISSGMDWHLMLAGDDSSASYIARRSRYAVEALTLLNSGHSEIMACREAEDLYFYSRAPRHRLGHAGRPWQHRRAFSLYTVTASTLGTRIRPQLVSRKTLPDDRALGMTWERAGNTYYVTRPVRNARGETVSRIFHSFLVGPEQVREQIVDLRSDGRASDFQPSLRPDGKLLVFASDRAGGYGGADLYSSVWEAGKWSVPVNLGPTVNTKCDDYFPAFNAAGILYYATDGIVGLGKLDIFSTELIGHTWTPAVNAGAPINSPADDFGMVWNDPAEGHSGYFTSNRNPKTGCDLYAFTRQPEIWGTIWEGEQMQELSAATVRMYDDNLDWQEWEVDSTGRFFIFLNPDQEVTIEVSASGYISERQKIDPTSLAQGADAKLNFVLYPVRTYLLDCEILDSASGLPIDSVYWELRDRQSGTVLELDTLLQAKELRKIAAGTDYVLLLRSKGYRSASLQLPLADFYGHRRDVQQIRLVHKNEMLLVGYVMDDAGKPLRGHSRIDIIDLDTKAILMTLETDSTGGFSCWLDRNYEQRISIFASHDGRETKHIYRYAFPDQYVPVFLPAVHLGLDAPSKLIYYPIGETRVLGTQAEAIDDIYFFMLHNPEVYLELRTYTDATGSSLLNDEIARKRSAAIATELVMRGGIDIGRITRRDYGERNFVNDCADGVDCPESLHLENRRTEVYFYRPDKTKTQPNN